MKRRGSASSSSSTSSSSGIAPTFFTNNHTIQSNNNSAIHPNKPKRVRAKKIPANTSHDSKSRSSIYRGVTRHRWTGRFEAHLWDKTTWNSSQNKRGRQIYLGAYDNEDDAARTYDLAALKYWGPATILNFPVESYGKEREEMQKVSKEEYLASLRRRSSGFSRGVSKYRGVARHHHNGRWEARIGRISGNKYLYLGTFSTQEEAAAAYDRAAIEFRGSNAVTNFDISNYVDTFKNVVPELQIKHEVIQENNEIDNVPFDKVQANEVHDHQLQDENRVMESVSYDSHDHQLQDENRVMESASYDSQDMIVMDPSKDHENPWDFCLDTDFNSLPLPDIPLEKASEFLGWLDDKVFEDDDIECIFDYENEFFQEDAMSGTDGCKTKVTGKLKGQDLPTSHSSSSLSTMASAGSNI